MCYRVVTGFGRGIYEGRSPFKARRVCREYKEEHPVEGASVYVENRRRVLK